MWDNVYLTSRLYRETFGEGYNNMKQAADRVQNIDSAAETLNMTRDQLMVKIKMAGLNMAQRRIKHLTTAEIERLRVVK